MRTLALLIALLITVIGGVGLLVPDVLLTVARYSATPLGLYVLAAIRIGMGLLLFGVSRTSRTPKTFRVIGAVLVVAGFVTPLFGAERAGAMLGWLSARGPAIIRVAAAVIVALGSLFLYTVSTGPRESHA